jgi:copper chaperone CopZ
LFAILAHELPGRLRFSLPHLRRDADRATALRDRLAALPGVTEASANPLTGSVLVLHDGGATQDRIIAAIELAGYRLMPNHPPRPAGVHPGLRPVAAIARPVVQAVAEKLLERLVVSALAVMI